jgi:hypothetical protein
MSIETFYFTCYGDVVFLIDGGDGFRFVSLLSTFLSW